MEYQSNSSMYDLYELEDIDLTTLPSRGIIRLSKSSVQLYFECPYKFYLRYIQKDTKLDPVTDYPRLCGIMVHRFCANLHKKHKHSGRFYYKTIESATKAWFYLWQKALSENEKFIKMPSKKGAKNYGGIGAVCIRNYWDVNLSRPDPIVIEKKYTIPWCPGFEYTGVFDQTRSVNIDLIKKNRPDLVTKGVLNERYDPVTIVDLKTGYYDYEVGEGLSDEEKIRHQYDLQRDIQAASYTLLYKEHNHGKLPLYFTLHQLKNNKFFTVIGDGEESQQNLVKAINHVIQGIKTASFPRNVGARCRKCDYTEICSFSGAINISNPDSTVDTNNYLPTKEKESEYKQGRFDFKYQKPTGKE